MNEGVKVYLGCDFFLYESKQIKFQEIIRNCKERIFTFKKIFVMI